jgi:N-acetylmuramoyl-L-alanine amidase
MSDRRPRLRRACIPLLTALLCIACASSEASTKPARSSEARTTASAPAVVPATAAPATVAPAPTAAAAPATAKPASRLPLAGKVVGIDPGHNGRNYADPAFINHLIWNGRERETCDTTGTSTDGGFTEARFNFNVARYLTLDLRAEGARVVLTRTSNDGVGPCVTTRAQILDRAHANVAIDIHADGGPAGGRGFAILEPVADGPNNHVIGSSRRFGADLRRIYRSVAGMPVSTYDGVDGIAYRADLAGLNLTTVPKVLIECGNMRNATDAALLVRSSFQQRAAQAFARSITLFLTGRP